MPVVKEHPELEKNATDLQDIAKKMVEVHAPIGVAIPEITSTTTVSPNVTQTPLLLNDLVTVDDSKFKKSKPTIDFEDVDSSVLICDKKFFNKLLGQDIYDKLRKKYGGIFVDGVQIGKFFNYLEYLTNDSVTINPFDKDNYTGNDDFFKEIQRKDNKSIKDAFSSKNMTVCERTIKNAITCYIRVLRGANNYNDYLKQVDAIMFQNLMINPTASTAKTQFGKKKSLKKRKKKV